MTAEDLLRQGKVDDALAELKKTVQQNPAEGKYRVFLFQLLSVVGHWKSAATQLDVAGELDPGNLAMVQAYREAIRCEIKRAEVFAGNGSPMIFGEPDRWVALLIQSLKHFARGQLNEAQKLRDEALEDARATSGSIEIGGEDAPTTDFQWIADADSRLGPVLEVFVNGQYYWVPFFRIAQIEIEPPADLRDFVWTPAHFTWANGGQAFGLIPSRYFGTDENPDPQIRLCRKTDWTAIGGIETDAAYLGQGQRMLATDENEYSLLDIRKIVLDVGLDTGSDAADESAEAVADSGEDG